MILIKISINSELTHYRLNGFHTMYVCLCKGITDNQIREAVATVGTHYGQVREHLGFASQCGNCANHAREIFNQAVVETLDGEPLYYAAG